VTAVNSTYKIQELLQCSVVPQFQTSRCEGVGYYLQFYCVICLIPGKLNSQVNLEKKKKRRQENIVIKLLPVTFSIIRNRITAASLIYSARESKPFLSSFNRMD